MSGDVTRQQSQVSEASTYSDGDSSDDDMDDDYYNDTTDDLGLDCPSKTDDPEYFEHEPLQIMDAEKLLNEEIERLHTKLKVILYMNFIFFVYIPTLTLDMIHVSIIEL